MNDSQRHCHLQGLSVTAAVEKTQGRSCCSLGQEQIPGGTLVVGILQGLSLVALSTGNI